VSRASTAVLAAAASVMATAVIAENAVARVLRRIDDAESNVIGEMRETAAAALSVPRPRATSSAADVVPAAEL
jgi:hypothetical protein